MGQNKGRLLFHKCGIKFFYQMLFHASTLSLRFTTMLVRPVATNKRAFYLMHTTQVREREKCEENSGHTCVVGRRTVWIGGWGVVTGGSATWRRDVQLVAGYFWHGLLGLFGCRKLVRKGLVSEIKNANQKLVRVCSAVWIVRFQFFSL